MQNNKREIIKIGSIIPNILISIANADVKENKIEFLIFVFSKKFIAVYKLIINKDINIISLLLKKLWAKILGVKKIRLVPNKAKRIDLYFFLIIK